MAFTIQKVANGWIIYPGGTSYTNGVHALENVYICKTAKELCDLLEALTKRK